MKKILLLGAGRSAFALIKKFEEKAHLLDMQVDVADLNFTATQELVGQNKSIKALKINDSDHFSMICNYDIVVSMLPPSNHFEVAKKCLLHRKHLITASYITKEIQSLHEEAKSKNLVFLMECGLDPGLDHMSAMKMIDDIKLKGGRISSFKSYCGGLMTDESDIGNPWKYKITWNPKNVVLAGQGEFVKYLEQKQYKYVNYNRLFLNPEPVIIEKKFYEGYPNRDSLQYISKYDLTSISTFKRGTLRKSGYCKAWNALIFLGLTDNQTEIDNSHNLSYKDFFFSLLPINYSKNWLNELNTIYPNLVDEEIKEKLEYLGMVSDEKIKFASFTPAQLLQHLLETKLKPTEYDKDLVVMRHEIDYHDIHGKQFKCESSLVVEGSKHPSTAMSKTVGLPIFYAINVLFNNNQKEFGTLIPTKKWIYEPILSNLQSDGINFNEFITPKSTLTNY